MSQHAHIAIEEHKNRSRPLILSRCKHTKKEMGGRQPKGEAPTLPEKPRDVKYDTARKERKEMKRKDVVAKSRVLQPPEWAKRLPAEKVKKFTQVSTEVIGQLT